MDIDIIGIKFTSSCPCRFGLLQHYLEPVADQASQACWLSKEQVRCTMDGPSLSQKPDRKAADFRSCQNGKILAQEHS